jgi:putative phosphoesterase
VGVVVAIISDTHLPRGRRVLPVACVERLRGSDLILHAGDFVELAVLRELERHGEVAAVHGNVDGAAVRRALPPERVVDAAGARIGMVHDAGPAHGRLERLRRRFPGCDAAVFGHSHIPLHERDAGGFQIFNPGSPTDRRRQPRHTMGMARIEDGRLELRVVTLD